MHMVKFDQGFVRPISGVISEPGRGANLGRVRLKLAGILAECHTTERLSPLNRKSPKRIQSTYPDPMSQNGQKETMISALARR